MKKPTKKDKPKATKRISKWKYATFEWKPLGKIGRDVAELQEMEKQQNKMDAERLREVAFFLQGVISARGKQINELHVQAVNKAMAKFS